MTLHQSESEFKELITIASQELKIEEIYIEKDYFVVLALKGLSQSKFKENGIFKGGTSLSKVYGVIHRFSEDIDMAILNDEGDDRGSKNKMRHVENALTSDEVFSQQSGHIREKKGSWLRQTVYTYPFLEEVNDFGQVTKHIFIDVSRISPGIPFEERNVTTYIHDYLANNGQTDVIKEFGLEAVPINSLLIERTFVEKFGTVVKFASQNDNNGTEPLERLKSGIRHIYDLHMLLKEERIQTFVFNGGKVDGLGFFEFLNRVLNDDLKGMRDEPGYNFYMNAEFSSCLLYKDIDDITEQLRSTYEGPFSRLLFESPAAPTIDEISESLKKLKEICVGFDKWKKDNDITF